jgi:hypothetical protein
VDPRTNRIRATSRRKAATPPPRARAVGLRERLAGLIAEAVDTTVAPMADTFVRGGGSSNASLGPSTTLALKKSSMKSNTT